MSHEEIIYNRINKRRRDQLDYTRYPRIIDRCFISTAAVSADGVHRRLNPSAVPLKHGQSPAASAPSAACGLLGRPSRAAEHAKPIQQPW